MDGRVLGEIYRREVGRCTATLVRVLGDVDLAEDAVAEAFAIAAERWPRDGVPPNPGAWITTTARNRAIDRIRRESTRTERHRHAHLLHDPEPAMTAPSDEFGDLGDLDVVADDQLRLIFLCCHPALTSAVALTLRAVGGLTTEQIARAYLVPEATMAQRISRAKATIRASCVSFTMPEEADHPARVRSV
ncbi:MAG: sigma factor, partial [Actinomycetota bacterium]|nr:sigma factor [Actinomycetota bacterium]